MKRRALAVAALVALVVLLLFLLGRAGEEGERQAARTPARPAAPAAPGPPEPSAPAAPPAEGAAAQRSRPAAGLAHAPRPRAPGLERPARERPAPAAPREPPVPGARATAPSIAPSAGGAAGAPPPAAAGAQPPAGSGAAAPAPTLLAEAAPAPGGPASTVPPDLTGAIRGVLLDRSARPIPLASIVAVSADASDAEETLTDDDGFFLLPGLRPGRYAVFTGLGGPLASQVPIRSVDVAPSAVSRLDLRERERGVTVRVIPRDPAGRVAAIQAVLVAGVPPEPGTFGALLSAEAIYLPRPHSPRTIVADVPDGTYTLVILQSARDPIRAAWAPIQVSGGREVVLDVELGSEPRG